MLIRSTILVLLIPCHSPKVCQRQEVSVRICGLLATKALRFFKLGSSHPHLIIHLHRHTTSRLRSEIKTPMGSCQSKSTDLLASDRANYRVTRLETVI